MLASVWRTPSGQDVIYPELSSPQTKEDYTQLVKDRLKHVLEEELSSKQTTPLSFKDAGYKGWNDIRLFDKPSTPEQPNSQGATVTGTLPGSPKIVYDHIWDISIRKTLEPDLAIIEVVESITPDIEVIRTRYSAPFPIAAREFVAVRYRVANEKDNEYYTVSFSINHSAVKSDSNTVRGISSISAVILRPVAGEENKTEFVNIFSMDPKGHIPHFLISLTKNRAADFVVNLRKILLDGDYPNKQVTVSK